MILLLSNNRKIYIFGFTIKDKLKNAIFAWKGFVSVGQRRLVGEQRKCKNAQPANRVYW